MTTDFQGVKNKVVLKTIIWKVGQTEYDQNFFEFLVLFGSCFKMLIK